MKFVGLTGGIGSGKTTVAEMFSDIGVPVYNSDREAKKIMDRSEQVKREVANLFGPEAYVEGTLNKTYISKQVFRNRDLLHRLNKIVHPAVRNHFLQWAEKQEAPYVIQETAIIFENGMQDFYDVIVLVQAPKKVRLQRVMKRDGVTSEKVELRMEHQLPDAIKAKNSDYIIENVSLETVRKKVEAIHREILAKG